jgi:uncharacterized protein YdeI (BOF family)
MQDLINSIVRFSAAMTLFSMQQMQNAIGAAADSQVALTKFRDALDSITGAITSQLDENKKPTLDSMAHLGTDIVDRTWDTMNVSAMDPRQVLQTTGDLMKKTSESLAGMMKKAEAAPPPPAGEPQPAASALAS